MSKKGNSKFCCSYIYKEDLVKNHGEFRGGCAMSRKCNAKVEVYSRVVGFYRPVQQWNKGKKEEFKDRKEYAVPEANSFNTLRRVS